MRSDALIERAGAHLAHCRQLQAQLDGSSILVRRSDVATEAQAALRESIALTRELLQRVREQIQSEGNADGDHEQ